MPAPRETTRVLLQVADGCMSCRARAVDTTRVSLGKIALMLCVSGVWCLVLLALACRIEQNARTGLTRRTRQHLSSSIYAKERISERFAASPPVPGHGPPTSSARLRRGASGAGHFLSHLLNLRTPISSAISKAALHRRTAWVGLQAPLGVGVWCER
jgi:hypothetical protein